MIMKKTVIAGGGGIIALMFLGLLLGLGLRGDSDCKRFEKMMGCFLPDNVSDCKLSKERIAADFYISDVFFRCKISHSDFLTLAQCLDLKESVPGLVLPRARQNDLPDKVKDWWNPPEKQNIYYGKFFPAYGHIVASWSNGEMYLYHHGNSAGRFANTRTANGVKHSSQLLSVPMDSGRERVARPTRVFLEPTPDPDQAKGERASAISFAFFLACQQLLQAVTPSSSL